MLHINGEINEMEINRLINLQNFHTDLMDEFNHWKSPDYI